MDHSWGRNVADLGLGGLGATLAARLNMVAGDWYILNRDRRAPTAVIVAIPPDMGPVIQYVFSSLPKLVPNFPFGYSVDADVPL